MVFGTSIGLAIVQRRANGKRKSLRVCRDDNQFAANDRSCEFIACYEKNYEVLTALASRLLRGDVAAAEDCVGAAVSHIWENRGRYSGYAIEPLLRKAVKHAALDELARAGRRSVSIWQDEGEIESLLAVDSVEERSATESEFEHALLRLPIQQRMAFVHIRVHERSFGEAAALMSTQPKTVQNLLTQALGRLRRTLGVSGTRRLVATRTHVPPPSAKSPLARLVQHALEAARAEESLAVHHPASEIIALSD